MEVKSVWDDMWERYSVFEKIIFTIRTIAMVLVVLVVFLAVIIFGIGMIVILWSQGGLGYIAAIFFALILVSGICAIINAFLHPKVGS